MANITRFNSRGLKWLLYSKVNSAGFITGKDGLAAADTGENSPVGRLYNAKSMGFSLPEATRVEVTGDNSLVATYLFDTTSPVSFDITIDGTDFEFLEAITGVARETISGAGWEAMPTFLSGLSPVRLCLIACADIKSQVAGQVGSTGYRHTILPNVELRYSGSPYEFQAGGEVTFNCIANESDTLIDGRLVSAVYTSAPNNKYIALDITSEYPLTWESYVFDGSDTTIALTYAPRSATYTKVYKATAGVFTLTATSSVDNTAPGYTVTPAAMPGASGQFAIVVHETANSIV